MIFILGGRGFVGSAFARLFESKKEPFEILTRENISHFEKKTCDIVINAAGNSKKWLAEKEPLIEFDQSVRLVRFTLENFKFGHYVQLSSCDVYPDCSNHENTREDSFLNPAEQSSYGFHKYLAELCVERFANRWTIFRLGGMVGPFLKKNSIHDLLFEKPLHLSLHSKLQFLSTDEVASLAWEVLTNANESQKYNLCGRGTIDLEKVSRHVGANPKVSPSVPLVHYEVNIEKLSRLVSIPPTQETVFRFLDNWRATHA